MSFYQNNRLYQHFQDTLFSVFLSVEFLQLIAIGSIR